MEDRRRGQYLSRRPRGVGQPTALSASRVLPIRPEKGPHVRASYFARNLFMRGLLQSVSLHSTAFLQLEKIFADLQKPRLKLVRRRKGKEPEKGIDCNFINKP
jgi:hypothetical protein